jgi:hypothetical protein
MFNLEVLPKIKSEEKVENIEKEKDEQFLMSPLMLDNMKKNRNSKKAEFFDELDRRIDDLVGDSKLDVFEKIIEANQETKSDEWEEKIWDNQINEVMGSVDPKDKLIDIPDLILGELLKPLPRENQERVYIQRDIITLEKMLDVYKKYSENTDIVFHVSSKDIKDVLKSGKGDNAIYFSTDIKRLFNLKEAKYIYAFRLNKKNVELSKYCPVDCFGKLRTQDIDNIQIDDCIKIFDENNPEYRKNIIKKLGASFEESYRPASDHASEFMTSRS